MKRLQDCGVLVSVVIELGEAAAFAAGTFEDAPVRPGVGPAGEMMGASDEDVTDVLALPLMVEY
jgi:hypothetical protein